jgi:hypothetical protein
MSDIFQEVKNDVVITAEDCNSALDFWRHFNIPIPADLQTAIERFSADPSFSNQEAVKREVCLAIVTSQHEAFRDDIFNSLREECQDTMFDLSFEKDLEEALTEDK